MKSRLVLNVVVLLLGGCRVASSSPARIETRAPASADSASRSGGSESLALSPPSGDAEVDQRIRRLQAVTRVRTRALEAWLELGDAWVTKARESSDPGFYVNADACASRVLELSPNNTLGLNLRTQVLLNGHRFEEARNLAHDVTTRDPGLAAAWGNLSDAWLELGDYSRAKEAAERMLDLKPNLPSYSRISYLAFLEGDHATAQEAIRLAVDASDPNNREVRAWVLVQAASLFWHRGDYEGADAGYRVALESLSEYPPALVGRARVALARRDPKTAASLLSRALERSPLVETAWLLGEAEEQLGHSDGALRAFARAEAEGKAGDPRSLSLMWSARGERPDEALRLAQAERARRGDIYTEDAVAWALYRNGRAADAVGTARNVLRLGTPDARLQFHAGAIELAAGDRARGRALLRAALAQNPEFDPRGAREARELLVQR
jgi:tetratricopeptide (TPR) repeat protein